MQTITVLPGSGKDGTCEAFTSIELQRGKLYTIVGSTGSGKSRFIKDIEQLAGGDSITHRHVLLDNAVVPPEKRQQIFNPDYSENSAIMCLILIIIL